MAVDKFEITGSWESVDGVGFELAIEREGPVYVGKMSVLGENADSETIRADSLEEVEKSFELFKSKIIKKLEGEIEMTNEKMDLQGLTHELDHSLGGISLATETIDDISTNLLHVMESMDNLPDEKDLRLYFREWHRDIRILAKLLYHASNDLVSNTKEARETSEQIFDEVIRNEK